MRPEDLEEDDEQSLVLDDAAYLRDLANRLMYVPAEYGTDQGDCDRLSDIARKLPAAE